MTNQQILEKAIQKAISNYEITQVGRVWNRKNGREVKGSLNNKGYRYFTVHMPEIGRGKTVMFHRLVALVHIPNPENKPHINHKDGNPQNNAAWNLEWCTPQENVIDGWNRGRVTWNKGNRAVYHRICIGCGLRKEFYKKRQQFCSKRCAAIVRGRRGLNERPRQAETGRFSKAVARASTVR